MMSAVATRNSPKSWSSVSLVLASISQLVGSSAPAWYEVPGAELAGMPQVRICAGCWLAYRKYSAVTPGGMTKDTGANTNKFPGLQQKQAKKATTLYLMPTLMARVSRKLPGKNVRLD